MKQVKFVKVNGKYETSIKPKNISRLVSIIQKQYQKFTGSAGIIPFALHTLYGTFALSEETNQTSHDYLK